ncbi:hypothetical protein AAEU29_17305 [Pseudoalteromonas sp. SSM20]|uniref:hypothetical protein n=1 Tax=Pseudoalteromonas sp. SSM20 TaxID=3139394 RepID=UPI003BAC2D00
MKNLISMSLVLASVALVGCESTPEVKPRMARFNSPEVNSHPFNFKLAVGSDTSNEISINNSKKADRDSALRFSAAMTLSHGFEARYVDNGEQQLSLKYQWLGSPEEEKQSGNVSLATSVGYIYSKRNKSASRVDNNWSLEQKSYDLSLIAGYRFNKQTLMYGSVFYQDGDIDGKYYLLESYDDVNHEQVNQGCGYDKTCVGARFSDTGKAYGASLALEYEFLTWLVLTGEIVHHRADWFNRSNNETGANVNLEFRF